MKDPRIIFETNDARLVQADPLRSVFEVADGRDAMGNFRWKTPELDDKTANFLRDVACHLRPPTFEPAELAQPT